MLVAQREQFVGAVKGIGQDSLVLDDAVVASGLLVDHEAAADRVVLATAQLQPGRIEGSEDHAVGVECQWLADELQVIACFEANEFFAQQAQLV